MIPTVATIRDLRRALLSWREAGETVAVVPTMGALHKGHLALIAEARKMARRTIATIFVNSLQFGPNEDLSRYPRPFENDRQLLTAAGCDCLYAPHIDEVYPAGFAVKVEPGPLAMDLEGAIRPGHFAGVATVVVKILLQAMPDCALFGEKDYQQLLIIRRVVSDLDIPVHIIGVPTVRDEGGLAFSSRNLYLTPTQRQQANLFPKILSETAEQIRSGKSLAATLARGHDQLIKAGFLPDYFELRDTETFVPLHEFNRPARLLAAIRLGATRLIDNMAVE